MTRKVIAVYGASAVGKSTTIKKAYDLLKAKYKTAVIDEIFVGVDIKVVLTINGKKIGIESQGDPGSRLEDSLSLFVNSGCQIIICATRTRGQTVEAVEKLQPEYEVLWLKQERKLTAAEQQASNSAMAKRIIKGVDDLMSV
jgi:hypothetical protein